MQPALFRFRTKSETLIPSNLGYESLNTRLAYLHRTTQQKNLGLYSRPQSGFEPAILIPVSGYTVSVIGNLSETL